MIDIPSIISENKKRVDKLFAPYDPILGIGSPLKREKLVLDEIGEFYLPVEFFSSAMGEEFAKSGSLHRFMERNRAITDIDDAWNLFINERANFDFEFFSA